MLLRKDAERIMNDAIAAVLPEKAVQDALASFSLPAEGEGRVLLVAIGKAAWRMVKAAADTLGHRMERGLVVTKYGHSQGALPRIEIIEAGHPVLDKNSCFGAQKALELVADLSEQDVVLFLVSGGGSAVFEQPLVPLEELSDLTSQLLRSGASITEINTIRKRLSAVKGGRFGQACAPARVFSIILSDVLGDPLDMIASGPAAVDTSTCAQALDIIQRYDLRLSKRAQELLTIETPKALPHVTSVVSGSVRALCQAAEDSCRALGYTPVTLADSVDCQARELGAVLAAIARRHQDASSSLAFLMGGETVVKVLGDGKGGRNQEVALAAALGLAGCQDTAVFSFGSDGTDGPTDAAGGFADEHTHQRLLEKGIHIADVLARNDAYPALQAADGLLMTGPTGTNVNDLSIVLIRR